WCPATRILPAAQWRALAATARRLAVGASRRPQRLNRITGLLSPSARSPTVENRAAPPALHGGALCGAVTEWPAASAGAPDDPRGRRARSGSRRWRARGPFRGLDVRWPSGRL